MEHKLTIGFLLSLNNQEFYIYDGERTASALIEFAQNENYLKSYHYSLPEPLDFKGAREQERKLKKERREAMSESNMFDFLENPRKIYIIIGVVICTVVGLALGFYFAPELEDTNSNTNKESPKSKKEQKKESEGKKSKSTKKDEGGKQSSKKDEKIPKSTKKEGKNARKRKQ